MKEIKEVLLTEIKQGYINWEKLQQKLHAVLNLVDNKFDCIRDDNLQKTEIKLENAVTIDVKELNGNKKIYKIFSPKFLNGKLYCSGLQVGSYDLKNKPFFINKPEIY